MHGLHAWCVLGGLAASACITVPPHQGAPIDAATDAPELDAPPCGSNALDCDDDGWVADAINPAADDCNDFNPAINPGARDEPGTPVDEDCIPDGAGDRLIGVTGDEAGWTSGALSIGFGTQTRMPSSLRIGGVEALGTENGCLTLNEEGLGVSLYPAFAAHLRTQDPVGGLTVERRGPVMSTSVVQWAVEIPAAGDPRCDVMTSLTANIRFTVLPGQRLIRDDSLTVNTGVSTCTGCGSGMTMPILSSYLALDDSYDRILLDGGTDGPVTAQTLTPVGHLACVRQSGGPGHVAMSWEGAGASIRTRSTSSGNTAVVFDWVRSAAVPMGNRNLTTSMIVDARGAGPCAVELQDAIAELASPPPMQGMTFIRALGAYQPTATPAGSVQYQALATIERGVTVLARSGFDVPGVTVWRRPTGGSYTRLIRDWNYLVQQQGEELALYMPALLAGDIIIIAGPGHEPAP